MENKKEYCIYIMCNGGKPYYIDSYDNLTSTKIRLNELIELEKKRNRPYYVHNDFYENEYPASINCKIFCIKQRIISEWETYSEKKEKEMQEEYNKQENNIILFKKYI